MVQYRQNHAPLLELCHLLFDFSYRLFRCGKRADSRPTASSRGGRVPQCQSGFSPSLRMDALELYDAAFGCEFAIAEEFRSAPNRERRGNPEGRRYESEHYLDRARDRVGADRGRQYSHRPAVE